jgi:Cytochrome c oxidase subunit IV
MKFNGNLFYFLACFYLVDAVGYVIWYANANNGAFEPIASAAIAMLAVMSLFLAFYLKKTHKNQGIVPEDRLDANIQDGDTEIGFFAPWRWWPFFLGAFGAICFASLAVGWWLFFIGFPLALVALIGFVFERSRGQYAH